MIRCATCNTQVGVISACRGCKRVEAIKAWAKDNYDAGGDVILETMTDREIAAEFKTLAKAKKFCKDRKAYADEIRATAF